MFILDSHCDTPSLIYRLRDITTDGEYNQVDFPKLARSKVDASFFSVYVSPSKSPEQATEYALKLIRLVKNAVKQQTDRFRMAYTVQEALQNKKDNKISIFLGLENGSPIQNSLSILREFYDLGVRYMTLIHSADNQIGDSCTGEGIWNGLSPFGEEVVAEMNALGMLVDLAHSSDKTFYDCLKLSTVPVVSTHSSCRALVPKKRNMSDGMIKALADKGGVIQINIYPCFISSEFDKIFTEFNKLNPEYFAAEDRFIEEPSNPEYVRKWNEALDIFATLPRPDYRMVVDHIDHAVKVGGIDHVGIGTDFDGITVTPQGLEDISKIGVIFDEMSRRGYSDREIEKVAGANFLRVLKEVSR